MHDKSLQEILPLVEQPSRYLGNEINSIRKEPGKVRLRMALAFPDLYEIGTSHFGIQILYHLLNRDPRIAAERVFAPGLDMAAMLRARGLPLGSLETQTPLGRFDIVGFSLLYELNYTTILYMLDLAGIPFLAAHRDDTHPLIIAGGPCTCNPEPVADFFDAMVVGDGERTLPEMAAAWMDWKEGRNPDRETLLKKWAEIEGVYVPAFFRPIYETGGCQRLEPVYEGYRGVRRSIVAQLDEAFFPDAPVVPCGKPVHDRLRLELARGCTRGCRFCQAGMIYRPVRERSPETLFSLFQKASKNTGYDEVSLLSLSTGDYRCIAPLMESLMARCEKERIAVSFPSLRAGTMTPRLMELIRKVRKTGFTIAPEAGSQRLRDVINKNIGKDDIVESVAGAFQMGWQVIKLYFMIGLPTETDSDLHDLVRLVQELRRTRPARGRQGKLNVSVTTFIPKAHTPFQWADQISLSESHRRIGWIQERLRSSGVQLKWQDPKVSLLEGLMARGDRRIGKLLMEAYRLGCRFDGWSDQFDFQLWQKAFAESGVDPELYTVRRRNLWEPLPWDHVDIRVSREYLAQEWEKATRGELTSDCRDGACGSCGVCDFQSIRPMVYESGTPPEDFAFPIAKSEPAKRLRVRYAKLGKARFFGHLELTRIFFRALRRGGVPVKFSEGFHPKPKISFDDPLPVGMESEEESFYLTVPMAVSPQDVVYGLTGRLPSGLSIVGCETVERKKRGERASSISYRVEANGDGFDKGKLHRFLATQPFPVCRNGRSGEPVTFDLRQLVSGIETIDHRGLRMILKSDPVHIRPQEVLCAIFGLTEEAARVLRVVKEAPEDIGEDGIASNLP